MSQWSLLYSTPIAHTIDFLSALWLERPCSRYVQSFLRWWRILLEVFYMCFKMFVVVKGGFEVGVISFLIGLLPPYLSQPGSKKSSDLKDRQFVCKFPNHLFLSSIFVGIKTSVKLRSQAWFWYVFHQFYLEISCSSYG